MLLHRFYPQLVVMPAFNNYIDVVRFELIDALEMEPALVQTTATICHHLAGMLDSRSARRSPVAKNTTLGINDSSGAG